MDKDLEGESYRDFVTRNYHYVALTASVLLALTNFGTSFLSQSEESLLEYLALMSLRFVGWAVYWMIFHLISANQQKNRYGAYWSCQHSPYLIQTTQSKKETQHLKDPVPDFILDGNSLSQRIDGQQREIIRIDTSSPSILQKQSAKDDGVQDPEQHYENIQQVWKINWYTVGIIIYRAVVFLVADFLLWIAAYTSYRAGINYSSITNIMSIKPFLVAFMFWYSFNERLTSSHYIGIVLLMVCIILNGFSTGIGGSSDEQTLSAWIPILCVIAACPCYALSVWILRYYSPKIGMTSQQLISDSYFVCALISLLFYVAFHGSLTSSDIIVMLLIAILSAVGAGMSGEAVRFGKGGPAQALVMLSSIWLLILEIIFFHQNPNVMQVIAFVFGLAGGLVITLNK